MQPEVTYNARPIRRPRSQVKRDRILEAALRHFARHGFHATRVESIADELGIAKGSVFQHFGTKAGLFLESYKRAVQSLPAYQDAPPEVLDRGFFATVGYWLDRTDHLLREDWIPYRVALLGNNETDLGLRREINRFLSTRDPYGTVAFVRWGQERGEVREDVELAMLVSVLDWTVERFQDALLTEELDPGLFRRHGTAPDDKAARVQQFLKVLRSAIGPEGRPASALRAGPARSKKAPAARAAAGRRARRRQTAAAST